MVNTRGFPQQQTYADIIVFEEQIRRFAEKFASVDHRLIRKRIEKAQTPKEIFYNAVTLIQQEVILLLYPQGECAKACCKDLKTIDRIKTAIVLEEEPFTRQQIRSFRNQEEIYVKTNTANLFNFKTAYLTCDYKGITAKLKEVSKIGDFSPILSAMTTSGILPVFYPIYSVFDNMVEVPVRLYFMSD